MRIICYNHSERKVFFMAKVSTNISIDADVKKQSIALFADLGLDLSTAVNLFLRQAIRVQGLPFAVILEQPNAETLAALSEYEQMKRHPEQYKRYASFDAALKDLGLSQEEPHA